METCPHKCAVVDYYFIAEGKSSLKVRFFLKDDQTCNVGILRQHRNRRWLLIARYSTGIDARIATAKIFLDRYLQEQQNTNNF